MYNNQSNSDSSQLHPLWNITTIRRSQATVLIFISVRSVAGWHAPLMAVPIINAHGTVLAFEEGRVCHYMLLVTICCQWWTAMFVWVFERSRRTLLLSANRSAPFSAVPKSHLSASVPTDPCNFSQRTRILLYRRCCNISCGSLWQHAGNKINLNVIPHANQRLKYAAITSPPVIW